MTFREIITSYEKQIESLKNEVLRLKEELESVKSSETLVENEKVKKSKKKKI